MKPRKKWEPEYRFGGSNSRFYVPQPLGTTDPYSSKARGKAKRRKAK